MIGPFIVPGNPDRERRTPEPRTMNKNEEPGTGNEEQ
jgi:hypothetical protein